MRSSVVRSAAAASRGELVALVDTCDRFDPESAAAIGLDLSRLLWIRDTGDATRALKAMNLVLQAGGFGLVVLDLADVAPGGARAAVHDLVSPGAGDRRQPDGGGAGGGRASGAQFGRRDDRRRTGAPGHLAASEAADAAARWTGRSDRARLLQGLATGHAGRRDRS